jgi:hypothetical protein
MGLANLVASTVAELDDIPLYFTDDIRIVFGSPTNYLTRFFLEKTTVDCFYSNSGGRVVVKPLPSQK